MLKKTIPIILLCLTFCIGATAENENSNANEQRPAQSQEMPDDRNFDRRENRPEPPRDETNGQMPQNDMQPPQQSEANNGNSGNQRPADNNENNKTDNAQNNENQNGDNAPPDSGQNENQRPNDDRRPNDNRQRSEMQNNTETTQEKGFKGFVKTYTTPIVSIILLALAYVFVHFYKRKQY